MIDFFHLGMTNVVYPIIIIFKYTYIKSSIYLYVITNHATGILVKGSVIWGLKRNFQYHQLLKSVCIKNNSTTAELKKRVKQPKSTIFMQSVFLCLLPPKLYKKTRQLIQFNKKLSKKGS